MCSQYISSWWKFHLHTYQKKKKKRFHLTQMYKHTPYKIYNTKQLSCNLPPTFFNTTLTLSLSLLFLSTISYFFFFSHFTSFFLLPYTYKHCNTHTGLLYMCIYLFICHTLIDNMWENQTHEPFRIMTAALFHCAQFSICTCAIFSI